MSTDIITRQHYDSAHDADDAGGVPDGGRRWYVAITGPRHEKTVARQLSDQGIHTYIATQRQTTIWKNGRRRTTDHVIIPGIVFIHCTEHTRLQIISHPLILRFMVNRSVGDTTRRHPPATIPPEQIHQLQFMLGHTDQPVSFTPVTYHTGDLVRVIRGTLAGLTGHITHNSDGTHTLTVTIPLLGGATVKIDPRDIEPEK